MNRTTYILRLTLLLTALIALLFASSCASELSPQEVTQAFWVALEEKDAGQVRKHVSAKDVDKLSSLDDVLPISNPVHGRTVIDENIATVDTTVTINGDKPLNFPLKTHLIRENGDWKIDYSKTIDTIGTAGKLAAVISKVQEFGSTLQDGIDRSVEELEQTLPQIEQELSRIEDQIKQHVPELRKRLENFAKELEDALTNPHKPETEEPDADGTVAI